MVQTLTSANAFTSVGEVYVAAGNPNSLLSTITAYFQSGKKIVIPQGVYNIGANAIQGTFDLVNPIVCQIEGRGVVTIIGSGTVLFDILNVAWISGKASPLVMTNIQFQHNCSNATDITLDLTYAQPSLYRVKCSQTNGTKQGTGFLFAPNAGAGWPTRCEEIGAYNYGTSYDIQCDHMVFIKPYSYGASNYHFWLRNSPSAICFIAPDLDWITGTGAAYGFFFDHVGSSCSVYNANLEANVDLTNFPFYMNNNYKHMDIYGVGGTASHILQSAGKVGLTNDTARCHIWARAYDLPLQNWGTSSGTGAQQTIAHGLGQIPNRVMFFDTNGTDRANVYQSAAADATNIYPFGINTKGYMWLAEVV